VRLRTLRGWRWPMAMPVSFDWPMMLQIILMGLILGYWSLKRFPTWLEIWAGNIASVL